MALLVEVVVDGGVNGDFLQTLHLPKAQHGPLSSSKWQVWILSPIVEPATGFLARRITNDFHRSAVRSKSVRYDHFRFAVALH